MTKEEEEFQRLLSESTEIPEEVFERIEIIREKAKEVQDKELIRILHQVSESHKAITIPEFTEYGEFSKWVDSLPLKRGIKFEVNIEDYLKKTYQGLFVSKEQQGEPHLTTAQEVMLKRRGDQKKLRTLAREIIARG